MSENKPSGISLTIVSVIVVLAIVAFVAGFFVGQSNGTTTTTGFSQADKNYLSQLEFVGGFCERQGLISSFRTTYNTDLNRLEGLPVCIQAK